MSLSPIFVGVALSATAAGCAHVVTPPPSPPPAAPLPEATRGGVELKFVNDPNAPPPDPHQEFHAPKIIGRPAMPPYPADALAANAGGTVALRITIDTEGQVALVEDSPVAPSTPGPFTSEFRAAAEKGARTWRFSPGEIEQLEDGKDLDGDGKPDYTTVVSVGRVPVIYDILFNFYVVKGVGQVRSSVEQATPKAPPRRP